LEDHRLAARAAEGDQEAFEELARRYRRHIYSIAFKIALDEDDALDIAQDVLLRLAQRIGRFDGRGSFRAWVSSITANIALDHLRRSRRRESPVEPAVLAELPASNPTDPRSAAQAGQRREGLQAALRKLSGQQRAIFTLYLGEELGPKDIADRLQVPAGQVRSQMHRAIQKLRRLLDPQPIEHGKKE